MERSGDRGSKEAWLASLRERVLVTMLTWLAAASMPLVGILIYQGAVGGYLTAHVWIVTGLAFGFVVLRWQEKRLGYHRSAVLLIGNLAVASCYLLVLGRLSPAGAFLQMLLVLVATLFFGGRAGMKALSFCLASLVIAGAAVVGGLLEPPNPDYWNPSLAIVWIRYGGVLAAFGGALTVAFALMIGSLEASVTRAEAALAREREEREKRELAQHALERLKRVEALGQLAAGIAHDFNNSLAIILATTPLIDEAAGVTPEISELTAEIRATAKASANTARQLLALGRDDTRRPQRVAVERVLRSLEVSLRRLLPEGVSLSLEISTTGDTYADLSELQNSFLNLALNGRDAMPHGGKLTISATDCEVTEPPPGWRANAGAFVVIAFRDTGIGMAPTTMERIFEPFFTTKEPGKGTGLGLAMVRKMANEAGGYALVESAVAQGTTVRLFLPRHGPAAPSS